MIRFDQVSKFYGSVPALRDFSLEAEKGETVVLLGLSGSGKTTTLRMVNGMVTPSSGQVMVREHAVSAWPLIELRRSIGYVIQEVGLFPHWTVAQNVGMLPKVVGWDVQKTRQRVKELLELVRLPYSNYARRYPSDLSGGDAQRVGGAGALALKPDILLMDEPFGALDAQVRWEMQEMMIDIIGREKTTVITVTHDIQEAIFLADRIIFFTRNPGRIKADIPVAFKGGKRIPRKEDMLALPGYVDLEMQLFAMMREEIQ